MQFVRYVPDGIRERLGALHQVADLLADLRSRGPAEPALDSAHHPHACQSLADVVMQFARDSRALLFRALIRRPARS